MRSDWAGRTLLVLHNLAGEPKKARIRDDDCDDWEDVSVIFGEGEAPWCGIEASSWISKRMVIAGYASTAGASGSCPE